MSLCYTFYENIQQEKTWLLSGTIHFINISTTDRPTLTTLWDKKNINVWQNVHLHKIACFSDKIPRGNEDKQIRNDHPVISILRLFRIYVPAYHFESQLSQTQKYEACTKYSP